MENLVSKQKVKEVLTKDEIEDILRKVEKECPIGRYDPRHNGFIKALDAIYKAIGREPPKKPLYEPKRSN